MVWNKFRNLGLFFCSSGKRLIMTTRNLSAIAVSAGLTGITALSWLAPAQAGEVKVACNMRTGNSTTIALNGGESIPFGSWSVSDAIDVAYAVKNSCKNGKVQSVDSASPSKSSKYRVEVNSASTSKNVEVQKDVAPAPVTVNSSTPQSGMLW
jgi:hypothetical protein